MIGGPALFGAICGVLLGASKSAYLIASILAIGGGFFAGFEHSGARGGALRGLCGGTLFGTFILLAHEAIGNDAKADLPHPGILLIVVTAVLGTILGSLGGMYRGRLEASDAAAAGS